METNLNLMSNEEVLRKCILPKSIFPKIEDYIDFLEMREDIFNRNYEGLETLDCKSEIATSELEDDGVSYEIEEVFENL